jgi:AraC family transcriptional regulator
MAVTTGARSATQMHLDQTRFHKVIDYIYDHMDEKMDLDTLSEIACVSPHHWHRIYRGLCGETLAASVKRLRLHRAAGQLANSPASIDEIASTSGYSRLQSFNRAFSETYGMPPAKFRNEGSHTLFNKYAYPNSKSDKQNHTDSNNNRSTEIMKVTIKKVDSFNVLAMPHTGSYMNIGNAFEKLFGWLGVRGLIGPNIRSVGIYYSDPDAIAENELQSAACVSLPQMNTVEIDATLERKSLAAGEYAVLRHVGPYSNMRSAYQWLYGEWLAKSGREVADQPAFEDYLNNPREVSPTELITDIYMPLKSQ